MSAPSRSPVQLGTFHATCWVLGLVAFVELVALGAALALRDQAPEVVERVVTEYVIDPSLAGREAAPAVASGAASPGPAVTPGPAAGDGVATQRYGQGPDGSSVPPESCRE